MAKDVENRKSAFVSYAQSSPEWQERVFDFVRALREEGGIEAEVDLLHRTDHQHWMTFGSSLIEESDYTLIAVDPTYKRRWLGREARGVGAGVAKEAATIRSLYERDRADFMRRIKVVLLPGVAVSAVPGDLLGECERFEVKSFSESGLEDLLRTLWEKPAFARPPLGPIPTLPQKFAANLEREAETPPSQPHDSAAESPSAVDDRDDVALRGALDQVRKKLRDQAISKQERARLERERESLEMLKGALGTSRSRRRKRARTKDARERAKDPIQRPPMRKTGKAIAGALVALGICGVIFGMLKADSAPSRSPIRVASNELQLSAPPGWRRQGGSALAGLESPDPITVAAPPGEPGQVEAVVAGLSRASGASLLPRQYRKQLRGQVDRESLLLGALPAYRYEDLRAPASGEPVTMFVAPTTAGVALLACRGGGDDLAGVERCTEIASTIRLTRGKPFPLGPSPALERGLGAWLPRLAKKRGAVFSAMKEASQAGAQAAAAMDLAVTFGNAAGGLRELEITPESAPAKARVVSRLTAAEVAYEDLADAALEESREHYARAKEDVRSAEQDLNRSLAELRSLGYRVTGG